MTNLSRRECMSQNRSGFLYTSQEQTLLTMSSLFFSNHCSLQKVRVCALINLAYNLRSGSREFLDVVVKLGYEAGKIGRYDGRV